MEMSNKVTVSLHIKQQVKRVLTFSTLRQLTYGMLIFQVLNHDAHGLK